MILPHALTSPIEKENNGLNISIVARGLDRERGE